MVFKLIVFDYMIETFEKIGFRLSSLSGKAFFAFLLI